MDRIDRMDRRARYSVGGAVAFVGVLLLVLGWYLVSGQALAAKQLPYLASASLPGAALLVCGTVVMLSGDSGAQLEAARKISELHALLTEAVAAGGGGSGGSDGPGGSASPSAAAAVTVVEEASVDSEASVADEASVAAESDS